MQRIVIVGGGSTGCATMTSAAGFSGHGFCLGPVSGLLYTDLALGRSPRRALDAFKLDRFVHAATAATNLTLHGQPHARS